MSEILVVDDHAELRALIREALELEGHRVTESTTAVDALEVVNRQTVDLVLLDIGLPDASGLDVLVDLHARQQLPVIFVSGRGGESDRVIGLRMGADDYITKPFSVRELTARVAVALRRSAAASPRTPPILTFGSLSIRPLEREVRVDDQPVTLTARELDLLIHLARHPSQVFSRDELLREIWRSRSEWQDPATVTEHIRRLRRKVELDPRCHRWIETVRGAGYRFTP